LPRGSLSGNPALSIWSIGSANTNGRSLNHLQVSKDSLSLPERTMPKIEQPWHVMQVVFFFTPTHQCGVGCGKIVAMSQFCCLKGTQHSLYFSAPMMQHQFAATQDASFCYYYSLPKDPNPEKPNQPIHIDRGEYPIALKHRSTPKSTTTWGSLVGICMMNEAKQHPWIHSV